jgi:LAO/AO transport system kinase
MAKEAPKPSNLDALFERLVAGDPAALARCITLIEDRELGAAVRRRIHPITGRATVVGFTGAPGVGKSTLVDAYIAKLRFVGQSVAVAAIDPSSPFSGGAVLGDRIRMHRHTSDPGVFIRSIASRGHLGGLSESIQWTIDAMDAAGMDVVIVETVGTGQSEVDVVEIADTCVVVSAPGLGDDVQAIKAGILEIADVLVVNKADMPHADVTASHLRNMLKLRDPNRKNIPIVMTSATQDRGIDDLHGSIERSVKKSPQEKQRLRARRMHRLIAQTAAAETRRMVLEYPPDQAAALVNSALRGEYNLGEAAMRVMKELFEKPKGDLTR